jgi:hypothetical protein
VLEIVKTIKKISRFEKCLLIKSIGRVSGFKNSCMDCLQQSKMYSLTSKIFTSVPEWARK